MGKNSWGWTITRALGAILLLAVSSGPALAAVNVHDIHVPGGTAAARPCADCHTGSAHSNSTTYGGGSGTVEVPTSSNAINFLYVDGTPDQGGTRAVYDAGVCTNVDCHGGNATTDLDTIGTIADVNKCGGCHYVSTADVDNFVYGDRTVAAVNSTQWGESGHGAGATYASGNTGANFAGPGSDPEGCAYCHDFGSAHGDPQNPFRLANNDALGNGRIDVCLVCHSTGDAGYDPDGTGSGYVLRGHSGGSQGKAVDKSHSGAAHNQTTDGGKFCWDCHDPHGDRGGGSGNWYMVQSAVSNATDGTQGIPSDTKTVTFTRKTIGDLATPGYYVESTNNPATGVCQACHTDAAGFTGEVKYWRNNQTEDVNSDGTSENTAVASRHNNDAVCTGCHQHTNAFAAGCTDCHGNSTTGARWPDSLANNPTRSAYADDAGAHDKHVTAIFNQNPSLPGATDVDKKNNTCVWCHPGSPPPGHPTDATSGADQAEVTRMDTDGNGFAGPPTANDYWSYAGGATATSGTPVYFKAIDGADDTDAYIGFSGGARSCSNVNCHSGQATPNWYGTSDTVPPTVANVHVNGTASLTIQQGETAQVTLTADATDAANVIVAGEYFVGTEGNAGEGTPMDAADGAFDEKTNEGLTALVDSSGWTAGTVTLYVDAKDAANNWGPTTAATVTVTVTPQDTYSVGNTAGSTGNVNTGATNVLMQTVTVTVTSGPVDLLTMKVLGTRTGTGDVAADVAQVKIYNDVGGSTTGVWEAGDTLIGSGFLNATTKDVTIDIADQTFTSGATGYLYILYDISGSATGGDVLGAQLTALTHGPTDSRLTSLPVPAAAQDVKTVVVSDDTTPPTVGTIQAWFGGSPVTEIQEETATVTLTAVASDTQNVIAAAEYFVGTEGTAGTGTPMLAADGAFNSLNENVTSNTGAVPAEVDTSAWTAAGSPYTIYVDAKDAAGNWGPVSAPSITITVTPKDVVTVTGTPQ